MVWKRGYPRKEEKNEKKVLVHVGCVEEKVVVTMRLKIKIIQKKIINLLRQIFRFFVVFVFLLRCYDAAVTDDDTCILLVHVQKEVERCLFMLFGL